MTYLPVPSEQVVSKYRPMAFAGARILQKEKFLPKMSRSNVYELTNVSNDATRKLDKPFFRHMRISPKSLF